MNLKEEYTKKVKWCWKAEKWLNENPTHPEALDRMAVYSKKLNRLFPLQEKIEAKLGRNMKAPEVKFGFVKCDSCSSYSVCKNKEQRKNKICREFEYEES